MIFQTSAYKLDSKGKIREYKIRLDLDEETGLYIVSWSYGAYKGKMNTTQKIVQPSKQKTSYDRAFVIYESKLNAKLDDGYKTLEVLMQAMPNKGLNSTIEQIVLEGFGEAVTDASGNVKPMLALTGTIVKKFQTSKGKESENAMKFPCFVQPKYNGVRCLTKIYKTKGGDLQYTFQSRQGKSYNHIEHTTSIVLDLKVRIIKEKVYSLMKTLDIDTIYLDGEIYCHNMPLNLISGAVRNENGTENSSVLKYYIYDLAIPKLKQNKRLIALTELFAGVTRNSFKPKKYESLVVDSSQNNVKISEVYGVDELPLVHTFTDKFINEGYEGAMFRSKGGMYEFGRRSKNLQRNKKWISQEYIIQDIVPMANEPDQGMFVFIVDGISFKVVPNMSHNDRRHILINKEHFIGKEVTLDFYEKTTKNIPFHVVGTTIRDYE